MSVVYVIGGICLIVAGGFVMWHLFWDDFSPRKDTMRLPEQKKVSVQDLTYLWEMRDFFPEGCQFYWNVEREKAPSETSVMVFKGQQHDRPNLCVGCNVRNCEVREKPNPQLTKNI